MIIRSAQGANAVMMNSFTYSARRTVYAHPKLMDCPFIVLLCTVLVSETHLYTRASVLLAIELAHAIFHYAGRTLMHHN